jgi:tRNA nucleotidyltransferase/poly(A) polymerase
VYFSITSNFPDPIDRVLKVIPEHEPVFLVGGAVRDILLGRQPQDLDLLLSGNVMALSRRAADSLGGAFFPLDKERDYARVILSVSGSSHFYVDFAPIRDGDLEKDLRSRDFTVNAIAIDLRGGKSMIDPLGGAADLFVKRLKLCSPTSLSDDPVRVLRLVRMAVNFSLKIEPETRALVHEAAPGLKNVSPERTRDELFEILGSSHPSTGVRLLEVLDLLPFVFPDLVSLRKVEQPPPHHMDVWNHTLDTMAKLESVLSVLEREYEPDRAANLMLGLAVLRLGRYRQQVSEHLEMQFTPDRSLRPLLFLAALYHDAGKPETRMVDEKGRIRFFQHDQKGADAVLKRGRELRLSSDEISRLETVVRGHMRPILLTQAADQPTRRAVYRYFRDLGPAGIDISLLSLADTLATYGTSLPQETWGRLLDVVRCLWEAYWEKPEERLAPALLVDGHALMRRFKLHPGPKVGELLEALREAQAIGQVVTEEDAFIFLEQRLDQGKISSR